MQVDKVTCSHSPLPVHSLMEVAEVSLRRTVAGWSANSGVSGNLCAHSRVCPNQSRSLYLIDTCRQELVDELLAPMQVLHPG
jgi:hypothetical protein